MKFLGGWRTISPINSSWLNHLFSPVQTGFLHYQVKPSDTTKNSDTTLSADAGLTIPLTPGTYGMQIFILLESPATADIKYALNYSGTATAQYAPTNSSGNVTKALTDVTAMGTDGTAQCRNFAGKIVCTDSGDLSFDWAQNSSDVGNTTVKEGSWMILTKV